MSVRIEGAICVRCFASAKTKRVPKPKLNYDRSRFRNHTRSRPYQRGNQNQQAAMKYAIVTIAIFAFIVFIVLYATIKNMPLPFEESGEEESE